MRLLTLLVLLGTTGTLYAAEGFYYGAGLGTTEDPLTGAGASVFDLHTGFYTLAAEGYRTGFELGYTDVSDSPRDGGWATALFSFPVRSAVNLDLRLGVDVGSQSGGLVGLGVGYSVERNTETRLEVVGREQGVQVLFSMIHFPGVDRYPPLGAQP